MMPHALSAVDMPAKVLMIFDLETANTHAWIKGRTRSDSVPVAGYEARSLAAESGQREK